MPNLNHLVNKIHIFAGKAEGFGNNEGLWAGVFMRSPEGLWAKKIIYEGAEMPIIRANVLLLIFLPFYPLLEGINWWPLSHSRAVYFKRTGQRLLWG